MQGYLIDLDKCVVDPQTMGISFIDPIMDVLAYNDSETRRHIREDLWSLSLDRIIAKYGLPCDVRERMVAVYRELEAPDCIKAYDDVPVLAMQREKNILVTTGFSRLQQSKIARLGLAQYFSETHIDALDGDNPGKKSIFADVACRRGWTHVAVVGDGGAELSAARDLGMVAIQILRPGVERIDADHYISNFCELYGGAL